MAETPDWQDITDRGVEAWALCTNKLHPAVRDFLQPLFDTIGLDLSTVRQIIYSKNTSGLSTNVWVAGDRIIWTKGHLNQEHKQWIVDGPDGRTWWKSNGAIDLATQEGMRTLCHELRHVHQYRTTPWWKLWSWYGWGVVKSLWHEGRWYSHQQVGPEVDAINWSKRHAVPYIRDRRELLKQFEELR